MTKWVNYYWKKHVYYTRYLLDIYVDFRNLNLRYQLDTIFFIHLDKMKILNLNLDKFI